MVDSFLSAGGGFSSGYFPGSYRSIGRKDDAVKIICGILHLIKFFDPIIEKIKTNSVVAFDTQNRI